MPKAKFARLHAWSFSTYQQYLKCPFSVCLEKIQRHPGIEEKSPALERGTLIHSAAEAFVASTGEKPELIPELARSAKRLADFRKAKARTELEWAFTSSWTPTGWWDRDAWLRMKLDVLKEEKAPPLVHIVDYKSGKIHDEHRQQRSLYGLGALQMISLGALSTKLATVIAEHLYTDSGQQATERYTLKDLEPLKREWLTRTEKMLTDERFPTRTGHHCSWCRFAKSKGGPCPEKQ